MNRYFEGLTEEQRKAVYSDSPRIGVVASAGSGKTRVLTSRIIRVLVERKAEISEIVAVTFTEKAAMEMKSRLRDAFSFFAENSKDNPEQLTLWRNRETLLETAQISTIHSFCAKILRQYSLRLGLDPEFSIIDEVENVIQLDRFLRERTQCYLENDEISMALATELSTSGLHQILFHLLSNYAFVSSHALLLSGLSDNEFFEVVNGKLVKEYDLIVREKLKGISTLILISNLRKLEGLIPCDSEHPLEKKRVYLLSVLEELRRNGVKGSELNSYINNIRSFFQSLKGRRSKSKVAEEVKNKVEQAIKRIWDSGKNGRGLLNRIFIENLDVPDKEKIFFLTKGLLNLFVNIAYEWKEYKRKQNILTFDDLICFCVDFFKNSPEICREVASDIKYLFVDEFQDTDSLQVELIDLLLKANPDMNFFFVGDAKQSIYMFRGAEVKVFLREKEKVQEKIKLRVNFRSAPEILKFVNDFFSGTNFLFEVEEPYDEMQPSRTSYNEPRVEVLWSKNSKLLGKPLVEEIIEAEAQGIAERIVELVNGGIKIREGDALSSRDVRYGDIALLFRTATHIYKYEKILKDNGIPCRVVCGRGFFDVGEVRELMTFLEVLVNPFDHPSLLGFLRGPFCALSDEQILRWRIYKPLEEIIIGGDYPTGLDNECYRRVRELYNLFRTKLGVPLEDLILSIVEHTGYDAVLIAQEFGEQKVANLQKFIRLVRAYSKNRTLNLFNFNLFLEEVKTQILEGEADIFISPEDAVVLTTVHKAKGLEFPIVILPHLFSEAKGDMKLRVDFHKELGLVVKTDRGLKSLTEGSNFHIHDNPWSDMIRLKNEVENEHEYVRLLYVALTRARDYLILCVPENYEDYLGRRGNSWLVLLDSYFSFNGAHSDLYKVVKKDSGLVRKPRITAKKEISELYNNLLPSVPSSVDDFGVSEAISVSQLLNWASDSFLGEDGGEKFQLYKEFSEFSSDLDRGLMIHKLMREWEFKEGRLSSGFFEKMALSKEAEHELRIFAEMMPQKCFYSKLKTNPPVHRELPFVWSVQELNGLMLRGIVDAVLSDGTIVDYKTGVSNEKVMKDYWNQLKIYYFALSDSDIFVNGNLMIVFVDEDKMYNKEINQSERKDLVLWIKSIIEARLSEDIYE
ncbi:MAG: UvrD-helicase domain-containing protein [Candidatus Hydrogenedentes bacterium]|nr:UvrD-helicase domain-containing protein [Candidatus Hydrogenedentota bacterium]